MTKKSPAVGRNQPRGKQRNTKPAALLILIPLGLGLLTLVLIGTGVYSQGISSVNNKRLATEGWQAAKKAMAEAQPEYVRQYAYYKVKEGQSLQQVADYFGVDAQKLIKLNPGTITYGTNIKIPPIEKPLTPVAATNGLIRTTTISDENGLLRVIKKHNLRQPVVTSIPELAQYLASHKAIEKVNESTYRINRAISIDGDIRIDITTKTVKKLELRSEPNNITCLCMHSSLALIDGVIITTYDPKTGKPDTDASDGRSFVRMKNGRLDIMRSDLSFLGNGLEGLKSQNIYPPQTEGGVYGVSWRIADDKLGVEIATGWIEKTRFHHNHFGAYTFGASGMVWRGNHFDKNEIYGLDPHDDSNNALVEDNVFSNNGKHGFIVSKRCNYNVIRNNTSYGNKLHGFMLHQDSAYNLIENNVSYDNVDNYVIYNSNYNTIRDNRSYLAKSSHIRINLVSVNNYITGNQLVGGKRGVFLYNGVVNTYVSGNKFHDVAKPLNTRDTQNTFFGDNTVGNLNYIIGANDRTIFGVNTLGSPKQETPAKPPLPANYSL